MNIDHGKNHIDEDRTTQKGNQCGYTSSQVGHLREHLEIYSGEKSNKCNECDFASAQADNLRIHVIMNPQIACMSHIHCICLTFLSTEEKSQANLIKHLKMQYFKGAP